MTPIEFAKYIRIDKTKTDTTSFTDDSLIRMANTIKDEMASKISAIRDGLFVLPYYTDLVAGQREYPILDNSLGFTYIEVKFDGTNWLHLDEKSLCSYRGPTDETSIINNFKTPKYGLVRKSLWLYNNDTIDDVTNGLKVWFIKYPADLTTADIDYTTGSTDDMSVDPSTTSSGFPKRFHQIWADKVVAAYKESQDRPVPLTGSEQATEDRFGNMIGDLKEFDQNEETTQTNYSVSYPQDFGYRY